MICFRLILHTYICICIFKVSFSSRSKSLCVYGKTILKETMEEHEAVLGQRPILSLIN